MPPLYLAQPSGEVRLDELDQAAYDKIVAAGRVVGHHQGDPIVTLRPMPLTSPDPEQGQAFEHLSGAQETVVGVDGDRVVTVVEYPTRQAFKDAVAAYETIGSDDLAADLPDS